MAENENVVVEEQATVQPEQPAEPSKIAKIGAAIKEWFRKLIVKLKRKTQIIPLIFILVTSLFYLCSIGIFAQVLEKNDGISNGGICMFANSLMSILVLALFLYAFPKRKKPNMIFVAIVFVVLALLIALDAIYYVNTLKYVNDNYISLTRNPMIPEQNKLLIVHMVLVGISIVVFAFLPLYKMGINKINTRKVIEENKLSEEIDTSAEV